MNLLKNMFIHICIPFVYICSLYTVQNTKIKGIGPCGFTVFNSSASVSLHVSFGFPVRWRQSALIIAIEARRAAMQKGEEL